MNEPTASGYAIPSALIEDLHRQNPWWRQEGLPPLPAFRRWPYRKLLERLEQPIAPILALRGPRQVGKTTLQQQLIETLLAQGVAGRRILRLQTDELPTLQTIPDQDEPLLRIVDWYERAVLGGSFNQAARDGAPVFLFFDEVQNLATWDVQLKFLVDHAAVRVMITGSSALRIARGRDSLAGRMQSFEMGPLRLAEIAAVRGLGELPPLQEGNGWTSWIEAPFWRRLERHGRKHREARDRAFAALSSSGSYPFAHRSGDIAWDDLADFLVQTVIERVIQHDLKGPSFAPYPTQLLADVFRLACRYAGQSPDAATLARELQLVFGEPIAPARVREGLALLDASLLLREIPPLEARLGKRKGHAKLTLCDHLLRAARLQEWVPIDPVELASRPHLAGLAGHLAESVVGYSLISLAGLDVAHFPERSGLEPEVDYVLTLGDRRIPIEVKYQSVIDPVRDTLGLRSFMEKSVNQAVFGLLIVRDDGVPVHDPRIICLPLKSFLLVR